MEIVKTFDLRDVHLIRVHKIKIPYPKDLPLMSRHVKGIKIPGRVFF